MAKKKEVQIQLLRNYTYRGAKIHIRQIEDYIFEYLVVYKNKLWADFFVIDEVQKQKLNNQQAGATTFLVCNAAEGLVEKLVKKYSFWYNVFWKHFTPEKPEKADEKSKKRN